MPNVDHHSFDRVTIKKTIPADANIDQELRNLSVIEDSHKIGQLTVELTIADSGTSQNSEILTQLAEVLKALEEIKVTQDELKQLLTDVDNTTTAEAANVTVIGTTVQAIAGSSATIATEVDALVKAAPVGTVMSDDMVATLQGISARSKATADASKAAADAAAATAAVLVGVAAEGTTVVPAPSPTPVIPPVTPDPNVP